MRAKRTLFLIKRKEHILTTLPQRGDVVVTNFVVYLPDIFQGGRARICQDQDGHKIVFKREQWRWICQRLASAIKDAEILEITAPPFKEEPSEYIDAFYIEY